jgi:hypothetical protein
MSNDNYVKIENNSLNFKRRRNVILYNPTKTKYILERTGNNIFYYNYKEYIEEKRRIVSFDISNTRLIKYLNNGVVLILDEIVD